MHHLDLEHSFLYCPIMPHYVTKLGKKITGMSCEAYVFLFCALGKLFALWRVGFLNLCLIFLPSGKVLDVLWDKNHDSNFFWSVGKEWQLECKWLFFVTL